MSRNVVWRALMRIVDPFLLLGFHSATLIFIFLKPPIFSKAGADFRSDL
jgi:hypothetical protein